MSTVAITITAPGGSPVDYTDAAVFERCTFTTQFNAVAGQFTVVIRDPARALSFVTGSEVLLEIDGSPMFGGYVTAVEMGSFAPAADTSDLATYELRTWTLTGVDYNIIFDKRVWRNTADYLSFIDLAPFGSTMDGDQLKAAIENYADLSDFSDSGIVNIADVFVADALQQGETIRGEFERMSAFGGAVWYASPAKVFVYKPYDDAVKRWGFSDNPNKTPLTVVPSTYQGSTWPFREVAGTEDGSYMVNDALVWGGSQFAGPSGGTVFARSQDATSITNHHRWQTAETHFGERLYSIQDQVDARADVIINGPPGADATGQQKGLKNPQQQFTFTWFSADVPTVSGVRDHVVAGDILNIELSVFSVTTLLPLRQLDIEFPDALEDDDTHLVQFRGTFGLQLSDPFTLWRYLLSTTSRRASVNPTPTIVSDSSTVTVYGATYSGVPTPAADGSTTVFTIPFGYITGSTQVYLNGLIQRLGTDYTESNSATGEITFVSAPLATDNIEVSALTLNS